MADRAREGVGRVVGLGVVVEVQEAADHIGYLALICSARPHNRLLNLHGGIFPHLDARKGTGNERCAVFFPTPGTADMPVVSSAMTME